MTSHSICADFVTFLSCGGSSPWVNTAAVGAWPSGKASVFGTVYRRFESYRPSQLIKNTTDQTLALCIVCLLPMCSRLRDPDLGATHGSPQTHCFALGSCGRATHKGISIAPVTGGLLHFKMQPITVIWMGAGQIFVEINSQPRRLRRRDEPIRPF